MINDYIYIYIYHSCTWTQIKPEYASSTGIKHHVSEEIASVEACLSDKPRVEVHLLMCVYAHLYTCLKQKKIVHICTYGIMWVHRHTTSYTIIHVGIVHCRCTWISLHTLNTARLCYKMLQTCTYGRERERQGGKPWKTYLYTLV